MLFRRPAIWESREVAGCRGEGPLRSAGPARQLKMRREQPDHRERHQEGPTAAARWALGARVLLSEMHWLGGVQMHPEAKIAKSRHKIP